MIQRVGGRVLNRQELARVGVVLKIAVSFHQQLVPRHEPASPAGHVETLARRMQFDADVFRARRRQKAQRVALEHQRRIGGIVNNHQVVLLRELHRLVEKFRRRARAGGVVRIVQHQDF